MLRDRLLVSLLFTPVAIFVIVAGGRWLARNREVYKATGKMMEKYNVINTELSAGGGEYPLQDGFGWTNGVAVALDEVLRKEETVVIQ